MLNKHNLDQKRALKSKDFWGILVVIFILFTLGFVLKAEAASPSEGGVYNGYNEPDPDFEYFDEDDFDCNSCDDDDDNDDEPDATTRSASSIGDTSATLNGRTNGNGSSTRAWFEYGRDRDLNDDTSQKSVGSGTNNVSTRVSGLRRDTTYYFRIVARNDEGTDYGSIMSFRTDEDDNDDDNDEINSDELVARTVVATSISTNSAQLNSVIQNDDSARVDTWFEWGQTTAFGNKTEVVRVDASPSIAHRAFITELAPGKSYYFRAVAENNEDISKGSVFSFTTTGGIAPSSGSGAYTPPPSTGDTTEEETPAPDIAPTPDTEEPVVEDEEKAEDEKLGLAANVLGFGFFPTTLLGWLALAILVLGIYILARKHLYPPAHNETVVVSSHNHH